MKRYLLCFCFALLYPAINNAQDHLLLSEVTLAPSEGEFIEIYNPAPNPVDLTSYYLADNMEYARVAAGSVAVDLGDFIVRFPTGFVIAPKQVMVIAMGGTDFSTTYAKTPDVEIISQDLAVANMITVASNSPALSNAGECIILFKWDGISDLVQDVDMVNAGVPIAGNQIVSKTGVAVDGPDVDAITTVYLTDANTIPLESATPLSGFSTKRILFENGYETQTGGNGITGNDETSENTWITWDDDSYTAPDPGMSILTTGINNISDPEEAFSLSPNPAPTSVTISVCESMIGGIITVSDVTGRKMLAVPLSTANCQLSTENFSSGVYFVTVTSPAGNSSVKKLAVSR